MSDVLEQLLKPPFFTESSERLLMERAANEIIRLRTALMVIELYVEERIIEHKTIADLAESNLAGQKRRIRMSEASDILGKIRAEATAIRSGK